MIDQRSRTAQASGARAYQQGPGPDQTPQGLAGGATRPRRIVLYSHDTQGLGHMRRNLLLARALLGLSPRPNILLVGGARELGALAIPEGIDCLTLPALHKQRDGAYRPRSLSISLRRMVELRAGAIQATVASYDPDLLIVDKVPLGAFGELEPTLRWLRDRGKASCVLGLREILDEPAVARREWAEDGGDAAVEAYYDQVWVYGDRRVSDPAREYGFSPAVAGRLVFTGYLDRGAFLGDEPAAEDAMLARLDLPPGLRLALCCVGGGQDGFALARAFACADLPHDMAGVILTGPFMPADERRAIEEIVARRPQLRVAAFIDEPGPLLRRASAVVSMAGYNTVCEILALGPRALLVPRVKPRREQLIRATRLNELGLVDMLHPRRLSAPALAAWLAAGDDRPADPRARLDMGALDRLPDMVRALASGRPELKAIACAD